MYFNRIPLLCQYACSHALNMPGATRNFRHPTLSIAIFYRPFVRYMCDRIKKSVLPIQFTMNGISIHENSYRESFLN